MIRQSTCYLHHFVWSRHYPNKISTATSKDLQPQLLFKVFVEFCYLVYTASKKGCTVVVDINDVFYTQEGKTRSVTVCYDIVSGVKEKKLVSQIKLVMEQLIGELRAKELYRQENPSILQQL